MLLLEEGLTSCSHWLSTQKGGGEGVEGSERGGGGGEREGGGGEGVHPHHPPQANISGAATAAALWGCHTLLIPGQMLLTLSICGYLCVDIPAHFPYPTYSRSCSQAHVVSVPLQGVAMDHYGVVVLGGTLGILLATALLAQAQTSSSCGGGSTKQGRQQLRVTVVERGVLVGRDQEWNCSEADLQVGCSTQQPVLMIACFAEGT